jgi:hypothetical protein
MELAWPDWWYTWMYSLHTPTIQFKSSSLFFGVDFHNDMIFPNSIYFFPQNNMEDVCCHWTIREERPIGQIAECYNDLKQSQQRLPCT